MTTTYRPFPTWALVLLVILAIIVAIFVWPIPQILD